MYLHLMHSSLTMYFNQASLQELAEVNSFTMCAIAALARWLKMDAQKTSVLRLDRNAKQ